MEPDENPMAEARITMEDIDVLIRKYAQQRENALGDGDNVLVTAAVVMYEIMTYSDEGDTVYSVNYMFPSPTSMTASYGIAALGMSKIEEDMLGDGGGCDCDEPS